jgi:4-amino-4-deoxy-L-arabinose transferase-like glycosyltransferase
MGNPLSNLQSNDTSNYRKAILLIATGIFLLSIMKLGGWAVQDSSEARYAHIGEGMYVSGDYVHPVYLGVEHYHKPPLTFQITAIGYKLFGLGAFGARFFLQISFLLQLLMVYLIGKEVLPGKRDAENSVMIYASFAIVWIATRNLTTDSYLLLFLLGSIWALVKFLKHEKREYLYALAVFGALGFLTKITAYFVTIGPVALTLMWYYRNSWKWTLHIAGAIVLFLALCSTWFFALGDKGLDVFKYLLYEQSIVRFSSDVFYRNEPFYYYLLLVPAVSFPWIIIAIRSMAKNRSKLLKTQTGILFVSCFLFPVIFYSLSKSKLVLYVLPAFPALAWYCAAAFRELPQRVMQRLRTIGLIFVLLLFTVILLIPVFDQAWSLSTAVVILGVLGIAVAIYLYRNFPPKESTLAIPLTGIMLVIALSGWFLEANEANTSTTKYIAEWIKENDMENRKVFMYDQFIPSLDFYSTNQVALIADARGNVRQELRFEEDDKWESYYYDLEETDDMNRLKSALNDPTIFVREKGARSDRAEFIFKQYDHSIMLGKWEVLY